MKCKVKLLFIFAICLIVFNVTIITSYANNVATGKCGDSITWEISDNMILTISGTGEMYDYSSASDVPWIDYREEIVSAIIKPGITKIGANAFSSATKYYQISTAIEHDKLKSISIPDTVVTVGKKAFEFCYSIENIVLPDSITTPVSFNYCYSLTDIKMSNNTGASCTFSTCQNLESIEIPEGITEISPNAFENCRNLKNVIIPNTVKSIGVGAFYYCKSLEQITLPSNLESIGGSAFFGCENLKYVSIPSAKAIDSSAFSSCKNLTYIDLPKNLITIGSYAFNYSGLTSILLPKSIESIGDKVPFDCTIVKGYANSIAEDKYKSSERYCFIEITDQGSCGKNAYWQISNDTLYITGEGQMFDYETEDEIPWKKYFSTIKTVVFEGEQISYIPDCAFSEIANQIVIKAMPETSAAIYASRHNIQYKDCIDYGRCGENAYWELNSLGDLLIFGTGKTTDFADGKNPIYPAYYKHGEQIKKIYIEDGIEEIGSKLDTSCDVVEVHISKSVRSVSPGLYGKAFHNSKYFYVDEENPYICSDNGIIFDKSKEKLICYPESEIAVYCVPDTVKIIGSEALESLRDLTDIALGNSLEKIEKHAFSSQSKLKNICIPDSVTEIEDQAFYYCYGIEKIYLPNSISQLSQNTFYWSEFTDIYYGGTKAEFDKMTVEGDYSNATIHYNSRLVTYNFIKNGGTSSDILNKIVEFGQMADLTPIAEKTGYRFIGWNTNPDATIGLSSLKVNDSMVLYAIFESPVTGVTLNKPVVSLEEGKTETLTATVLPANATDKAVTWKSSAPGVASVSNGVVTALKAGTAVITATTADGGYTASCTVTVTAKPIDDNAPKIKISEVKAKPGNEVDVTIELENNTGFASMGIEIGYNSDIMTLTKVTSNSSVGGTFTPAQAYTVNPFNMGWDSAANITYNGNLATLTFKIADNAADGIYPITLDYYKGRNGNYADGEDVNYDENDNAVGFVYISGSVIVASYIPGDINGDEKVNNKDATFLLRYLAGWSVDGINTDALDTDGSGTVNN